MTDITTVKQRFGIIGTSELLDRALEVAVRVAPTDLTVLVTGESGVGKEFFPQVIHAYSARKHNKYIAVNCAAIPEGTIDSELFGHEKGSFTGALEARKGYFEEADDPGAPAARVADGRVHPRRVVQGAENRCPRRCRHEYEPPAGHRLGRFREDLYYRLSTVPITVPSLRERPQDIPLLFRKFAADVAAQYRMPAVTLDAAAREMLMHYYWRGNIRQLKNVAEQISAIEQTRLITADVLSRYRPPQDGGTPAPMGGMRADDTMSTERELLYKVLFDMRADINDLKRMMSELMHNTQAPCGPVHDVKALLPTTAQSSASAYAPAAVYAESEDVTDEPPREMTKADMQREQIIRALRRNNGRRREAAAELFMSERTLYRKIKELGIDEN